MSYSLSQFFSELGFKEKENPPLAAVKKRWLELCQLHHPDHGGDPEAFKRVTHAYRMITDASYRQREVEKAIRTGQANGKGDLNIRIICPVSFEDAFFGRTLMISFNALEFNPDFTVKPLIGKSDVYLRNLKISLPAGSVSGSEHTFPGLGHRCQTSSGDCTVSVAPEGHPVFKVEGDDVISHEKVPLELLLKGGKIEVVTMYGPKVARIKPGTPPGSRVKIRKCGVAGRGHHLVVVDGVFPDEAELKKDGWRGLGINWDMKDEPSELENEMTSLFERLLQGGKIGGQ